MTVVNITASETVLGTQAGNLRKGHIYATYWAGDAPYLSVAGAQITFPATIVVPIVDGAPVVPVELVGTAGVCCVKWLIQPLDGPGVERFTTVPDTGTVNFGDLPVVDPVLFTPVVATPTLAETIDVRVVAGIVDPETPVGASLSATFVSLTAAAKNPDLLIVGAITLDGSDQVTSAAVVWPDGTPGTLTITSRHASGAVTAYNITYGSPVTKTFTQPTITRNSNGAATDVPQIVVS